jgi:hypothetical protein
MATRETTRPIVSLMTHVASDLGYLVQTEFRLAKAEVAEKLSSASSAGVYLAVGGAVALGGLIVLLFDVARWIARAGLAYEWSLLIVAVVALAIGAALAMVGVSRLKGSAFVPERTLGQVREDYVVAKEHVR